MGHITIEEINQVMREAFLKAKTRPEIVYAYEKTGRILTKANSQFLTKEELDEWDNAIAEYHEKLKAKDPYVMRLKEIQES